MSYKHDNSLIDRMKRSPEGRVYLGTAFEEARKEKGQNLILSGNGRAYQGEALNCQDRIRSFKQTVRGALVGIAALIAIGWVGSNDYQSELILEQLNNKTSDAAYDQYHQYHRLDLDRLPIQSNDISDTIWK